MRVRLGLALCCALLTLAVARAATAEDGVALQLRYMAPGDCPNAASFFAQVTARTALARAAAQGERASELVIAIAHVAGGSTGTLELTAPDGASSTRSVSAAQCEQVVTALALMTALAVDPNASVAAVPKPAPAATPSEPVHTDSPSPSSNGSGAALRARWRWEVGAALEALGGVAPQLVFFPRPFVELAHVGRYSFALRLSASRGHAVVERGAGGAELTLWAGRLEACPVRVEIGPVLRVSPCLAVDAGQLRAAGTRVMPANHVERPWLAGGGIGRLEFGLWDVLAVELSGELFVPFVRDRFFVGANTTVHRAPAVAGGAALGLGVRFP